MADLKITELTANTALASNDLMTIVDDPLGTPLNQKITWDNVQNSMTKVGKVAVTQPATGSTLVIADGATLTAEATSLVNQDLTSDASPTFTAVNATTFDTNVTAAGVTLNGTTLAADGTDANIDISITPKGTGEINLPKVDIDSGTIDGVTIGGSVAPTVTNLGTVTTCDINGGTIDGTTIATSNITVGSGKTLDVSGGTLTLADGQIKANKLQSSATDLGASDVTVNLSNSNGAFNTNLTIDGTLQAGSIGVTGTRIANGFYTDLAVTNTITGSISGNAATVTTNANLTGIVTSVGNATAIASGAITADKLQSSASDLGAADVAIVLSNSNGSYVTNLTTDGTITATTGFAGPLNGTVGATTPNTIVGTTITANTGLVPDANDGAYLGQSGTAFSDLFLASGGVIDFAAGNATLTHSTGLITSNVPMSLGTSNALTVGTIELGHASQNTLSASGGVLSVEGVVIPSVSSTNTLTNKRITKRVTTTTDDATAVIDIDACDVYELSAIANATEFTTTGTPTDGQMLMIRLKDAGAAKGLTWTGFTAIGVTLPTTTVASKWTYVGCTYNSAASAWHAIAVTTQA